MIKKFAKRTPKLNTIPASAFVIETVDTSYWFALVVSAEHEHFVWVADFVGEEEGNGLNTIITSINIISHYNPFIIRWRSAHFIHYTQHIKNCPWKSPATINGPSTSTRLPSTFSKVVLASCISQFMCSFGSSILSFFFYFLPYSNCNMITSARNFFSISDWGAVHLWAPMPNLMIRRAFSETSISFSLNIGNYSYICVDAVFPTPALTRSDSVAVQHKRPIKLYL